MEEEVGVWSQELMGYCGSWDMMDIKVDSTILSIICCLCNLDINIYIPYSVSSRTH